MSASTTTSDVFTLGEAMLRLSVPVGERLLSAPTYDVHVGGSESNVAVALARLGRRVVWASIVDHSELGRRVIEFLAAAGVDTSSVHRRTGARLGTYFVELRDAPATPRVLYDRVGSAFSTITADDVDWDRLDASRIVHLTGITPALSPSCSELVNAVAERVGTNPGQQLSIDVNFRAKLWSPDAASATLAPLLRAADLVLCSAADAALLFGATGSPSDVAARLADECGAATVISAGGGETCWHDGTASGAVPAPEVRIVDRIGAGDALAAGVLDGLLDGDLGAGVARGVTMAAITMATRGDSFQGDRAEVESLSAGGARRVDR